MNKTYIAVMDYRDGSISLYEVPNKELPHDELGCDDVEQWLYDHTNFSYDECCYMCNDRPIKIYKNDRTRI